MNQALEVLTLGGRAHSCLDVDLGERLIDLDLGAWQTGTGKLFSLFYHLHYDFIGSDTFPRTA
jgi:hypothetical protein